ncbi:MAG: phosphoglucosamine mutase [Rikenellaceae bacterium]|nr:phosphoglucosamine mutase [Rikenellaceae bacterium]
MTLIKSISGIRGTIGGAQGDNLTPADIVKFTSGYAVWLRESVPGKKLTVAVGRDARLSGEMVNSLVEGTLAACGVNVIQLGWCTTPEVEMAVTSLGADGGLILTASHNPKQWNALKLLNAKGEFLDAREGIRVLELAESDLIYPEIDHIGRMTAHADFTREHIRKVLELPVVNVEAIRARQFKVVVDAVNSVGGLVIPALLRELGAQVIELNCEPTGEFAHNPEPLPENLTQIAQTVVREKADLGIVVDPDVDRLALVNEDGSMFGEEYTLVAVADYTLSKTPGNTVSNLSSSRALRDVTEKHGCQYSPAAVGEVNVVAEMKRTNAVIGGEGNGGIIYPRLHYGRDALVGTALFLSLLAERHTRMTALRAGYPNYYLSKNKIELTPEIDMDQVLAAVAEKYADRQVDLRDGVKIDFPEEWVHLRKSNTEPIIRIYSESSDRFSADRLAERIKTDIREVTGIEKL